MARKKGSTNYSLGLKLEALKLSEAGLTHAEVTECLTLDKIGEPTPERSPPHGNNAPISTGKLKKSTARFTPNFSNFYTSFS